MKDKILNALMIIILVVLAINIATEEPTTDRYEVVTGNNMLTILVDKQTGETWRNCICGEKSNVPGCWEKMITINPEEFNKPIGEAKSMKKMMALQKRQAKLQEFGSPTSSSTSTKIKKSTKIIIRQQKLKKENYVLSRINQHF